MKLSSFKYKTRTGPDYRHGEQVTFLDIKHTFGLGNIRIGSWVTKDEKELAANIIFDALADLAFILSLPPHAIGLRGSLNLVFGSGGRMGVQAHYAPFQRELALAKNAGAGALAHEFWHAYDHYIAGKAFNLSASSKHVHFASNCWLENKPLIEHPLNHRLQSLFNTVLLTDCGSDKHDFVMRSVKADHLLNKRYYSIPTEMMARAFESVIETCTDISNSYLVAGTTTAEALALYPDQSHRDSIYQALIAYFKPLGDALQRNY